MSGMETKEPIQVSSDSEDERGASEDPEMCDNTEESPPVNTQKSSNISSSQLVGVKMDETHLTDYMDKHFEFLVSIVESAPSTFPVKKISEKHIAAGQIADTFERMRKHVIHHKVTDVEDAIVFAVADIFISKSRRSSWYGPKLVAEMLGKANHRARYIIMRLILNALHAQIKLSLSGDSMPQLLAGFAILIRGTTQSLRALYGREEGYTSTLNDEDDAVRPKKKPSSRQDLKASLERNLVVAFKLMRLFVINGTARDFINSNDDILHAFGSIISNPQVPEQTFQECLRFAAKCKGFLGSLDKKEPLGSVPQVVMHVAEYCMMKCSPSWSVPRFLSAENRSNEQMRMTSTCVFLAVKAFAASIRQDSLFFGPFCESVMKMCAEEAASDKGTIIGQAFGILLSSFPSRIPLTDEFMVKLISGIHSPKDEIGDLVSILLDVIITQYPDFVRKHEEAIHNAKNLRHFFQDALELSKDIPEPQLMQTWEDWFQAS